MKVKKYQSFEVFIILIIVLLSFIAIVIPVFPHTTYAKNHDSFKLIGSDKITALQDNFQTSGGFYMGSGYINENLTYSYFVNNEEGKIPKNVSTSENIVRVIDNETENIRVESYKNKFGSLKYIFYIPKGSIKEGFLLDLKNQ